MIRYRSVHKSFGDGRMKVHALRGFDLEIPAGQMCALMGPSGSGKSTILHLTAGLVSPDAGSIALGDREITSMSESELTVLRRREVGMVFQFFNLLPFLSAYENVALPLRLDGMAADEEEEKVVEALNLVGIEHRRDHKPHEMSGGESQRIAIARALVISPNILLADEPTGNLDSVSSRQVIDLLRDLNEQLRVTMLIVTHDPIWGASCDRIIRLTDGVTDQDIMLDREHTEEPELHPQEH